MNKGLNTRQPMSHCGKNIKKSFIARHIKGSVDMFMSVATLKKMAEMGKKAHSEANAYLGVDANSQMDARYNFSGTDLTNCLRILRRTLSS